MSDFDPTQRGFVSYIDKSREYYLTQGYSNPYRWASHPDAPFTPLTKPLAESRVALVTTAAPDLQSGRKRSLYAAATRPVPEALYTRHLSWHKTATHTDDVETFLPVRRLNEYVAEGRLGSLSPRFYGVPTVYSVRQTVHEDASAVLDFCREDGVDIALLVAL